MEKTKLLTEKTKQLMLMQQREPIVGDLRMTEGRVMYLCSSCHHNVAELPSIGCDHCLK